MRPKKRKTTESNDLFRARLDQTIILKHLMIGFLSVKHIYRLSDEGMCERWLRGPYFQLFSGEEFSSTPSRTSART